jgi:hypothetical protein
MSLAKKGLRRSQVDGKKFLWKVRGKISHNEWHNAQIGIPIQHESGGQLFIAYVGYSRSCYEAYGMGDFSLKPIMPSVIKDSILQAIKLGWSYEKTGKPVIIRRGQLTEHTL